MSKIRWIPDGTFADKLNTRKMMYGLIYPAVLGTAIVAISNDVVQLWDQTDKGSYLTLRISATILILAFFCLSFANEARIDLRNGDSSEKKYGWPLLVLDFFEVSRILVCFPLLGFMGGDTDLTRISYAYGWFILILAAQPLVNHKVDIPLRNGEIRFRLIIGLCALCSGAVLHFDENWVYAPPVLTTIALIALVIGNAQDATTPRKENGKQATA